MTATRKKNLAGFEDAYMPVVAKALLAENPNLDPIALKQDSRDVCRGAFMASVSEICSKYCGRAICGLGVASVPLMIANSGFGSVPLMTGIAALSSLVALSYTLGACFNSLFNQKQYDANYKPDPNATQMTDEYEGAERKIEAFVTAKMKAAAPQP